jgi:hypothetical protein
MFAFMGSPSSIRVLDVPKSIGTWEITSVRVAVLYPNNLTIEKVAVRTGSVWVATIEGCEVAGKVGNGLSILADGIDEDGSEVSGYVLGKGDVFILENDSDVKKLLEKYTVRYLDEVPAVASVGDLLNINGQVRLFDGERWLYISNGGEPTVVYDSEIKIKKNGVEVGSFTTNASEATTIDIPVPSTTSELVNDSGFITSSAIPSTVSSFENDVGYITASAIPPIPSQTSDLENDSGYITASAIPPIPSTTSDLVNNSGFITASAIPSQVSAFENDVGYLTATSSAVTQKRDKTDLSYSYIYNPSEYWNIPRWVVVYDGSTFNLDKYNSEKLEWTDGSGNWSVKVDFAGMEVTPYFTLFYQTTGVLAMTPTEGSGSTTWNFTLLGEPGTVEMDMDGTLTTVDAV